MKTLLFAFLGAVGGAIMGVLLGILIGLGTVEVFNISNFEGGSGYAVAYIALLFGIIGLITGVILGVKFAR